MRRLFRPAAACLCILAMFLSAAGESARTLYKNCLLYTSPSPRDS